MVPRISPNRRRSIAVLNQTLAPRTAAQMRRRAYSIAPGDKLSPAAKARRSLAPRKSILKGSFHPPVSDNNHDSEENSHVTDETQAMDFTEIQPPTSRKSLARRVSFASHAHVRLFEIPNRNNEDSPSSPATGHEQQKQEFEDQNTNPSVPYINRRRSSRRSSTAFSEFGEQSMDMDEDEAAPSPADFLRKSQDTGSAIMDDDFDEDESGFNDEDDMDMTEAMSIHINRKRSLSLGGPTAIARRRSSVVPLTTATQFHSENQVPPPNLRQQNTSNQVEHEEQFNDQDLTTSSTQSQDYTATSEGSTADHTQPMEFTIPISRSLRPPQEPDPVWLALQRATHAGVQPPDPPSDEDMDYTDVVPNYANDSRGEEAMELAEAMNRLKKARDSLGLPMLTNGHGESDSEQDIQEDNLSLERPPQEDSFTSTEDSFDNDDLNGSGDRTVNVTALRRMSSMGGTEASMDVTSVYEGEDMRDDIVTNMPVQLPASAPEPPASQSTSDFPSRPPVFSLSTGPSVFSALGPIQTKTPAPPHSPTKAPAPATIPKPFTFSLSSRPPSPAKGKAPASPTKSTPSRPPLKPTAAFALPTVPKSPGKRDPPTVGRLSPNKKATFEPQPNANRRVSAMRRPSGYFAQRKSLGGSAAAPVPESSSSNKTGSQLNKGRASVGGAALGERESLYPDVEQIARDDPPTPVHAISPAVMRAASPARPSSPAPGSSTVMHHTAKSINEPSHGSPRPHSPASIFTAKPAATSGRADSPVQTHNRPASHAVVTAGPVSSVLNNDETNTSSANTAPPVESVPGVEDVEMEDDMVDGDDDADSTTQQWRDGVQGEDALDDEGPPISIEHFFEMTGIRFMELTALRRSTIHPAQMRPRPRPRLSSSQSGNETADDIPLAEFVTALAVDIPQLELYSVVANDLNGWIQSSKKICEEAERETEKVVPGLFREFVVADDSEKAMLLHQLKLIKANHIGKAKSQWYDWKLQWVEQLYTTAEEEFVSLEKDAEALQGIITQAKDILPGLREEYEQVLRELEQDRADVAEIEGSNQQYLSELRTTIAEQEGEVEAFRADVSEANAKLARLQEKLSEIESQKLESTNYIAEAERILHVQKESTSAEVFRLKDELEALQVLHMWRITTLNPDLIELEYASRYIVHIPCRNFKPTLAGFDVRKIANPRNRQRDNFPQLSELALTTAPRLIAALGKDVDTKMIVERLADFWSSCAQLRLQLTLLKVKYPVLVEIVRSTDAPPTLKATATVLFESVKAKALISFIFDTKTLSQWPMSIDSLKCDVEVAYGRIGRDVVLNAVLGRLSQATPADNHGCLLDSCLEATELFES